MAACGLVAQLDRVFDYESKGRGFESRRAHFPETLKIKRFRDFCFSGNKTVRRQMGTIWVLYYFFRAAAIAADKALAFSCFAVSNA